VKAKTSLISLGDVAKAAGVSKATTSYVLRNQPGPSPETRERVLRTARELGYIPDARIVSWMAKVREAKVKDLVPLAWLDTNWEKDSWKIYKFHSPYLEGARARARELGYQIEEIWAGQPDMTMRRISQILYQRGIEGVIVTQPAKHIRLNWNYLATVSLEGSLLAPRLHRVMTDHFFNLLLALKVVKRLGYRRIGICFDQAFSRFSNHACYAAINQFLAITPKAERVEPLYYNWKRTPGVEWIRHCRPEVIVCQNSYMVQWAKQAGLRVPEDIGIVHIATDDDVSDWAGIHSKKREIGATAVERVVSLLQNRQFGIPETAVNMVIRGKWQNGCTLLSPKQKFAPRSKSTLKQK